MTTEQTENIRILRELQSAKCFCGAKKLTGRTFCTRHYYSLPKAMRDALYQLPGEGYEGAYAKAREYFEQGENQ